MIQAVIFDIDNTLYDYDSAHVVAFQALTEYFHPYYLDQPFILQLPSIYPFIQSSIHHPFNKY